MDFWALLTSPSTWIIFGTTFGYVLYKYGTQNFDYFRKQGIPGPKPRPFVGNLWGMWKKNIIDFDRSLMDQYGKNVGLFDGSLPNLFTTDADLIRLFLVKDFDHFVNRRGFEIRAKYLRKAISVIRDEEWKEIRSAVSPTFTTGKIKRMSVLIKQCSELLVEKLLAEAQQTGKLDAKKVFSTFTMDVIAKCAFGMTIDNLGEEDDDFMKNASVVFNPPVARSPLILIPFLLPKLNAILGDRFILTKEFKFFFDLLVDVVNRRKDSQNEYHDFIEVATEAIMDSTKEGKGNFPTWTREDVDEIVIAQASLFLLAGFDTTASTLTNTCYMLAKYPDVQERLYNEVMSRIEKYGEVNHEMILDFPYMDQVINEVLRLHSPLVRLERECSKDVTYNGIHIRKGTIVTVPVYPLHYSSEYYSDPEKFDPERWSPENKHKLNPYAFLPFGLGPRACVGMRFAMEELKIALSTVVSKVRFFAVKETPEKLRIADGFIGVVQPIYAIVGIESR